MIIPANGNARAFATAFYQYLGSGVGTGEIRLHPNPVRLLPGGLNGIPVDGFALLSGSFKAERQDQNQNKPYLRPISGEKIVHIIA